MPTKYQVQVKMTPKVNPSQIRRDAAISPTTESRDPLGRLVKAGAVRPIQAPGHASFEPHGQVHPAHPHGVRTATPLLYEPLKRVFDFSLGVVLLTIATPIILTAAVAIRVETKGSPFFIQKRLGKGGRPFKIVKLRGMFVDSRTRFAGYYDYSSHQDLEFCFHHEVDPRVTRAGRFIRKTSIDELPNLWNVVLGDMSLVGPRPEIPEVLALYGPYRDEYVSVKPGITCLSKITGRDRLTKRETIEFDLGYIRKRSLAVDLRILWTTFRSVLMRRDVF
jgi:lipopolysaccharide/colanic/teichoic acid biosynthesis glycosyltransferase